MPMRVNCKHYETRTYGTGETVHMCRLDLAPEAPWRCPDECVGFEQRVFDAGWTHGSLARKALPDDPPRLDADTASLLDQAEDIVNSVGREVLDDVGRLRSREGDDRPRWKRLFRRR